MFGSLFKKKDTQRHPSAVPKEGNQSLSTTEAAALTKKVAALTTQIEQITDDKDKRHLLYNQLGATQVKLGNDLEAIAAYEASVKDKEEFGDAYNALLNLYETQRKQAAKAKMMTTFKNGSQKRMHCSICPNGSCGQVLVVNLLGGNLLCTRT